MRQYFLLPKLLLAVALAALAFAGAARAAEKPDRGQARRAPVQDQAESIRFDPSTVAGARAGAAVLPGPASLHMLPLASADDRGSFYTDGARDGTPGGLTGFERAKLAGARAAVEAARAAGTLYGARPVEREILPDAAAVERMKLEALRALPPVTAVESASGLGPGFAPVQKFGPAGLNAIERAKVEALRAAAPADVTRQPAAETGERKGGR